LLEGNADRRAKSGLRHPELLASFLDAFPNHHVYKMVARLIAYGIVYDGQGPC
jgi:hypothetical protein